MNKRITANTQLQRDDQDLYLAYVIYTFHANTINLRKQSEVSDV